MNNNFQLRQFLKVIISTSLITLCIVGSGNAQEKRNLGRISGSLESNSIYYVSDRGVDPDQDFGTNNYLKLDYSISKFSAGIQYELYAPVLMGFEEAYKKHWISNKYMSWTSDSFSVTLGDFYEQFGSGLVLRSYEDRALGFNNSLFGARATYNYKDILNVRALWGLPRLGMEHADAQVSGADASINLSSLMNISKFNLSLEASLVNRNDKSDRSLYAPGTIASVNLYSGRINFEGAGFSLKGEAVLKGAESYLVEGFFQNSKGSAQLVELGYNNKGFGALATYRRLHNMSLLIMETHNAKYNTLNILNYIPSLTRQHTYMLANLNPYMPDENTEYSNHGEQGGQLDLFYNFKRGSMIGGKYGMKAHLNASVYYGLIKNSKPLYTEISFDVEKQWNKEIKTTFMYSRQFNNAVDLIISPTPKPADIFVADILYKFSSQLSARLELQYLTTAGVSKDWMAALAEVNFAPRWSVFVSDMYNHSNEKVHYYSTGVSYAKSRIRVALSYGRNKEGYVCSGGVCRSIPAYTGGNLLFTMSF